MEGDQVRGARVWGNEERQWPRCAQPFVVYLHGHLHGLLRAEPSGGKTCLTRACRVAGKSTISLNRTLFVVQLPCSCAPQVRGVVIVVVRMLVSLRSQKMYVGDVKYTCGSVRQHIYRFSPLNCQYFGGARPPRFSPQLREILVC